jgi:hypothetical protein
LLEKLQDAFLVYLYLWTAMQWCESCKRYICALLWVKGFPTSIGHV